MPDFKHDYDIFTDTCIYCGARYEAVLDGLTSSNCDIVRHKHNWRTGLVVTFGIIVCAIPLIGLLHPPMSPSRFMRSVRGRVVFDHDTSRLFSFRYGWAVYIWGEG